MFGIAVLKSTDPGVTQGLRLYLTNDVIQRKMLYFARVTTTCRVAFLDSTSSGFIIESSSPLPVRVIKRNFSDAYPRATFTLIEAKKIEHTHTQ